MPIECGVEVEAIGQEQFHALDKVVMRHAFDIHNTLGRFCDERIYQKELARRCRAAGLSVEREVH
ncbi:MAG: GxxExxY protein, partial [Verrucomicrobiota bacterium]|nr:GxxExxY protein [Verrucomicrobiota bacterium]